MRTVLAAGLAALVTGALATACTWSGVPGSSSATDDYTFGNRITSVTIDNGSGDVTVRTADVTSTTVHETLHYMGSRRTATPNVSGDSITLTGCGNQCSIDYQVTVPRGAHLTGSVGSGDIEADDVNGVDVRSGSGDITVRNASGTVNVQASSGNVHIDGASGPVTVRDASGTIDGSDLRGTVDALVESGSITLNLTGHANVQARAVSGNVTVTAPPGVYRITGDTVVGHRDIVLTSNPNATATLDVETTSGNVTVNAANS